MAVEEKETIGHIDRLGQFLSTKSKEELDEILAYWEKIKAEWERKRKEFWDKYGRNEFLKLLRYKCKYGKDLEWQYEYLDKMDWLEREKFINEYLYDDILYSWKMEEQIKEAKTYRHEDLVNWRIVMEEWDTLNLWCNGLGWKIKNILKNIELSNWVTLNLSENWLWDEWAEAVSKMELKEWVELYLNNNEIWDEWAEAIMKNMELKNWVRLNLQNNRVSSEVKKKLKVWGQSFRNQWINCEVILN